jgi:hypothetical protein
MHQSTMAEKLSRTRDQPTVIDGAEITFPRRNSVEAVIKGSEIIRVGGMTSGAPEKGPLTCSFL